MFADPLSVKVLGTAKDHVRITSPNSSQGLFHYESDGTTPSQDVTVKQNVTASRFRREFRISKLQDYEDPISGTTKSVGASVYLVVDEPRAGFTDVVLQQMVLDVGAFFSANSGANAWKLLLGEA